MRSWGRLRRGASSAAACLIAASACTRAYAAATGALADTIADWMSVFVLIVVPPAGIYLFWMLHILPEKAAKRRNHPQKEAIHMLCLLSLLFGGLLWPIAMLWAYIKPLPMRVAVVEDEHGRIISPPDAAAPDDASTGAAPPSAAPGIA